MSVRLPTYAAISLVLVCLFVSACSGDGFSVTSPTTPTTNGLQASVVAEPDTLRPEFLSDFACAAHPAFGLRLVVVVGGDDLIVRDVRFVFTDRFRRVVTPEALLLSPPTTLPIGVPIPFPSGATTLPSTSPIPVPGFPQLNGTRVVQNSRLTAPFFLRFGCDVVPEGSILVTVDTSDTVGRIRRIELSVPVKQAGAEQQ